MAELSRRRRVVRAVDRALLGAFMSVLALILERRLKKALRADKEDRSAEVS